MKRIALMALLGLGIATDAHSQQVRLGLTGGVANTRLAGPRANNSPVPRWRPGLRGGLVARALLSASGRLAVQTELLYSGQGFGLDDATGNTMARQRLHYLQLPVLMQVKLANVWLEAGPEVSYLLGRHATVGTGGLLGTPTPVAFGQVNFRRWEMGYALGAGYQCTERLRVGLRYTGGLTTVAKPMTSAEGSRPKNQVVSLQATYLFGN